MLRPSFTVTHKDGNRYDANHLAIVKSPEGPRLVFECSGQLMQLDPADVEAVEFDKVSTATWCPWCDQPIDGSPE